MEYGGWTYLRNELFFSCGVIFLFGNSSCWEKDLIFIYFFIKILPFIFLERKTKGRYVLIGRHCPQKLCRLRFMMTKLKPMKLWVQKPLIG